MQQEQQPGGKRRAVICAAFLAVTTFGALGQADAATVSGSQLLPISSIKASNSESTNPPANAIDGSMTSRWSGYGAGVTLTSTFSSTMNVHSVDIAWYRGDTRKNTFSIAASSDGSTWKTIYSGTSSGITANGESYDVTDVLAKYVRVTVQGNNENLWASISELKVYGVADSNALFTDSFTGADGLITNEYAYWNPTASGIHTSPNWELDSGSLFRKSNMGWTGVPDAGSTGVNSTTNNDSVVFRLNTKRMDFGDIAVEFDLLNKGLVTSSRTPAQTYDGVHIWTRYQSEYNMYYASLNRRDGAIVIKKKVAGGTTNGGTYYTLASGKHSVPYGSWQKVKVTTKNNSDGSVTVSMYLDGTMVLSATDKGTGGAPIRHAGATGIRTDNCQAYFDNFKVSAL